MLPHKLVLEALDGGVKVVVEQMEKYLADRIAQIRESEQSEYSKGYEIDRLKAEVSTKLLGQMVELYEKIVSTTQEKGTDDEDALIKGVHDRIRDARAFIDRY